MEKPSCLYLSLRVGVVVLHAVPLACRHFSTCLWQCLLRVVLPAFLCCATGHSQSTTVVSPLQLSTSDPQLQQAFDWAKEQALQYVSSAHDPVMGWYEAALPGRAAFCIRDVSHQVMG